MRLNEFITESSTLSALGVDRAGISNIHQNLRLKHDTEFEPIKNKTEAKAALQQGKVIIAVNDEGKAYGFGKWMSPMSGGTEVIFGLSDHKDSWARIDSLTKALAQVKGRGFKFYVSTTNSAHKDRYDRSAEEPSPRDEGAPVHEFLKRVDKVYGKMLKTEAKKGYQKVRRHLMKLIDKEEKTPRTGSYIPTDRDMNAVKDYMKLLKDISERGLEGWSDSPSRSMHRGELGAMEQFFPGSYYYQLNSSLEDFQANEKLALQKFVKYFRKDIANQVDIATKGGYEENPKNAANYRADRAGL